MRMRIHVKPGSNRYTQKIDDESVMVGRELACVFRKNNMAESQEKTARFDFFHIATHEFGFGIDRTQDVINVGMISGAMQKEGTWFHHHTFPKGKLYGKAKVTEFLRNTPEAYEVIRKDVMTVMEQNQLAAKQDREALESTAEVEVHSEDSHSGE